MDKRKLIAVTARMDGYRVIAEGIGEKREVSDLELLALCTFAQVGLLSTFAGLDGEVGERAQADLERLIDKIRVVFDPEQGTRGLNQLAGCTAAILGGERLGKYVIE